MSYEERKLMYKRAVKYRAEYKNNKLSIYNGLGQLKVELDDVHMTEKQIDDLLYLMWRRTLSESSITAEQAKQAQRDRDLLNQVAGESGHRFQIRSGENLDKGGLENGQ